MRNMDGVEREFSHTGQWVDSMVYLKFFMPLSRTFAVDAGWCRWDIDSFVKVLKDDHPFRRLCKLPLVCHVRRLNPERELEVVL